MLATTVATQGLVPWMIVRLGSGPALALGLLLLGAPAPLYGLSPHLAILLPVSAVRGTGFALLTVIGATLTGRVAPRDRHGESVGLYGLSIALPNLAGVPAGRGPDPGRPLPRSSRSWPPARSSRFRWPSAPGLAVGSGVPAGSDRAPKLRTRRPKQVGSCPRGGWCC